mgnify:FL=1
MEVYTVVVEGEVVKKPEKPQLIDFAKMPRENYPQEIQSSCVLQTMMVQKKF